MNVLVYTHEFPPFLGGLATSSYKLVKGLHARGFDVSALVPSYGKGDREVDRAIEAGITRIPLLGRRWVKMLPLLQYVLGWVCLTLMLLRNKPDVVLFITEEAEVVGGLLPFYRFKPVTRVAGSGITTIFFSRKPAKNALRYPLLRLYRNAAKVIAVSNSTKELLVGIGVDEEKVAVVYNGVDDGFVNLDTDAGKVESLRGELGIGEGDSVIVTVARVLPRKGQDMVIRSLPMVLVEVPNLKYVVVGEGRYVDSFRLLARELGVEGSVIFAGGVGHGDTVHYYDMCDLFVMPNRYWNFKVEGLPNAVIEASARGKPVVAGRHAGSMEAVVDGETGLLVDPESAEEIAGAIIRVIKDRELAAKMGEEGRKMVLAKFREGLMMESYSREIRSLP